MLKNCLWLRVCVIALSITLNSIDTRTVPKWLKQSLSSVTQVLSNSQAIHLWHFAWAQSSTYWTMLFDYSCNLTKLYWTIPFDNILLLNDYYTLIYLHSMSSPLYSNCPVVQAHLVLHENLVFSYWTPCKTRICLGAYRTSPAASLHVESYDFSLELRQNMQHILKLSSTPYNPSYECVFGKNLKHLLHWDLMQFLPWVFCWKIIDGHLH